MYNVYDTIAAVSSAAGTDAARHIVRLSGTRAFEIIAGIFEPNIPRADFFRRGIVKGKIRIENELALKAAAYIFPAPHSYTGDDVAELHIQAAAILIQAVMQRLLTCGARSAQAGEFTARAYLSGKMDLAQAEAVAQIVSGSNQMQLTAAQRLLAGKLSKHISDNQARLLDLMSRIEAGLDFSGEDIEFISRQEAIDQIDNLIAGLEQFLKGSISCEEIITLPSVGIAGSPNAGKSSLLNSLLQQERSIVSQTEATTRDVLTGVLKLTHCNCALFDCAGLMPPAAGLSILEQLAQNAAIEAIQSAQLIIFCVDISKQSWNTDIEIFKLIAKKSLVAAATKCDIPPQSEISKLKSRIENVFGREFLPISSITENGLEQLKESIEDALLSPSGIISETADIIGLNQRHRNRIENAIDSLRQARTEITSDNQDIAAMLLKNSYRAFADISEEGIDDAVLKRIFSHFCIGK